MSKETIPGSDEQCDDPITPTQAYNILGLRITVLEEKLKEAELKTKSARTSAIKECAEIAENHCKKVMNEPCRDADERLEKHAEAGGASRVQREILSLLEQESK